MQHALPNRRMSARRVQVDAVGLYGRPVLDQTDLHVGMFLQELVHDAFLLARQMLDDDKGHAAIGGHV